MKIPTLILLALGLYRVEAQPNVPVFPPPPILPPPPLLPSPPFQQPPASPAFPNLNERFPLSLTNPGGAAPVFSSPFQTSGFVQGFTNTFGGTNTSLGSTQAVDFTITNTLATLPPVQVQAIVQVQVSLNTLQNLGATIGGPQNFARVLQQNSRAQVQIQQTSAQIRSLAPPPFRPTDDVVVRLSQDLLRAATVQRLAADHELVLATVIFNVMNTPVLEPAVVDQSIDTAVVVLETTGIPAATTLLVGSDLQALALDLQAQAAQAQGQALR